MITPIRHLRGLPDFSAWSFEDQRLPVRHRELHQRPAVLLDHRRQPYFFIVTPVNRLMDLRKVEEDADTKTMKCPECRLQDPRDGPALPFPYHRPRPG